MVQPQGRVLGGSPRSSVLGPESEGGAAALRAARRSGDRLPRADGPTADRWLLVDRLSTSVDGFGQAKGGSTAAVQFRFQFRFRPPTPASRPEPISQRLGTPLVGPKPVVHGHREARAPARPPASEFEADDRGLRTPAEDSKLSSPVGLACNLHCVRPRPRRIGRFGSAGGNTVPRASATGRPLPGWQRWSNVFSSAGITVA